MQVTYKKVSKSVIFGGAPYLDSFIVPQIFEFVHPWTYFGAIVQLLNYFRTVSILIEVIQPVDTLSTEIMHHITFKNYVF